LNQSVLRYSQRMVRTELRERVAWITLDRPEKRNAMTLRFWAELRSALDEVEQNPHVRVAVFHGAGAGLSSGGDIEGFAELEGPTARAAYVREAVGALLAVERMPKPTIAAVHGHALGGGCELTLVCDLVVADETARFGTPEASVGLAPGLGILRGRSHVNLHWLKYMIFTGASLDAETARLAGLVQAVVPEGEHLATAERWAAEIAKRSPSALAAAKRFLVADLFDRFDEGVALVAELQGGADHAEGLAAFAESRTPSFADA
jgi:enoyl-CoA hydratase